jgi:ureidoglycolate lyase
MSDTTTADRDTPSLVLRLIDAESFRPYGTLIEPMPDGQLFGLDEAQLELSGGMPRFYIMNLERRPLRVGMLTRHRRVTQCLASADAIEWMLVVAAPDDAAAAPNITTIGGFLIPGGVAVKLHRGTWHAGPFFNAVTARFFNLELTDTNDVDHQSVNLTSGMRKLEYRLETGP